METIYWIQRLGQINTIAWIAFALSLTAMIICFLLTCINSDSKYALESEKRDYYRGKKGMKIAPWFVGISMLIGIFTPSEKDLYVIYGVGGTIDYIKSNDTAKKLPDKVVNALDAWIDKQTENEK